MRLPGFTGEVSLYETSGRYRPMASAPRAFAGGRGVLPQLPIGFCMADCDVQYKWGTLDNEVCKFDCLASGNGGGGGGGVGGGPDLSCSTCLRQCNNKPVAQRKACRQLCNDVVC
jgi:hypothetical protein